MHKLRKAQHIKKAKIDQMPQKDKWKYKAFI